MNSSNTYFELITIFFNTLLYTINRSLTLYLSVNVCGDLYMIIYVLVP